MNYKNAITHFLIYLIFYTFYGDDFLTFSRHHYSSKKIHNLKELLHEECPHNHFESC